MAGLVPAISIYGVHACARLRPAQGPHDGKPTKDEQQILDWLASQRGAMLALLETLVNTDSGSYDKAGVDAVGAHIRAFLDSQGIASEVTPDTKFGDAINATVGHDRRLQPADPADGPSRHRVSQGRADPPAVQDRRRTRLRPRRLRHEVGPGDELLHPGGAEEVRRRARAGDGAVHRRRGDRLAVLARGDRAVRARRPARCSTPSRAAAPASR